MNPDNLFKNLKICHVTTVDITARFIILNFLKNLKSQGVQIFLACSAGKFSKLLEEQGFAVKNINMTRRITPVADFISLIKLFLYFRKEKFDIVHTYTPKAGVLGRIAARLAGVPIVIHTSYGFYVGAKIRWHLKFLIILAEKFASYFCDLIFSQNKEDIEWALKNHIAPKDKIKHLTYGIDISRFDSKKFSNEFILNKKKELGLENKKIIGMVGRFVKEKGYLDLFSAFKRIKEEIPDSALLLVAPKDAQKIDTLDKNILKEFEIEKSTLILGYENEISNIEEIYPLMDVFVLPSYREGFPYSIMEASATGVPVVATDIRGCREAVEDGTTGKLVPLSDPKKLAQTIMYFLKDSKMAAEFGRRGREKAEKEFDERLVFDKIKIEYYRLIKEKIQCK